MPAPSVDTPLTVKLAATALPEIRSVRIDVVAGVDAGASLTGRSERLVIGTHRTADLVLADPTVSRFHLEIGIDADCVVLRDLGSRNGTSIEGLEIEACRLRRPTIVTLGQTQLRIDLLGDVVRLALAPEEQFGELIGAAPVMRLAFQRLHQAALADGHVLIEGERGTGKNAAAAALHERGPRGDAPLEVVDCAAAALEVEGQLLGRGGRAGALDRLDRLDAGTLIFDEIGALARGTQRALVRALERNDDRRRRVRVIALSRRNLRVEVNAGRFAPELFELLAMRIRLPALREHPEDIALLVQHFVAALGATASPAAVELIAAESLEHLSDAPWPGNVRELRAHVEQALVLDGPNDGDLAEPLVDDTLPLRAARARWLRYFERIYAGALLERTSGNVSAAATLAGIDRISMHRMITRAGLREQLSKSRER
jgi:two-component system, NtrC family, response regulator GlrR